MNKRILFLTSVCALAWGGIVHASPSPPPMRESVAVCDPAYPNNCAQPNSSGQLPITGTISASNPSVSATGAAVPSSATYVGFQSGANLTGISSASPLPVTNTGTQSNASSGVATSSTNIGGVSWNYGFNGTTWDQFQVDGSKYLKVTIAASPATVPVSGASGSFVDGAIATLGTKADTATCATANTELACIRQLHSDLIAALPAGTNVIGGLTAASHAQTAALASSVVAKASAGTLFSFSVVADSTLNTSAWYVIIYDATSLPANGAVTPAKCYYVPAGQSTLGGTFASGGVAFTTGITIAVSTSGCFTQTASAHAFIAGDYQ